MECREVMDAINRVNAEIDPRWKIITAMDIGTHVWYEEFVKANRTVYEEGSTDPFDL